jgi:DNA-binding transcriptional MocR family regulator
LKRYERYADEIATLIRKQTLRPGDRLPSVRQASTSRRISPATVFEAYYLLEARGLIHARPRSGYYVSNVGEAVALVPETSRPKSTSATVAISDLVFEVLGSIKQREVVPLGSAFPSPELFPLSQLSRSLGRGMRDMDPWRIVDDLTPGNERLRQQIARRYGLAGVSVNPDEIVITNGAMEALNLSLAAVTRPGDVVVVESPTFYAALQALERLSLKVVEVATSPRDGIDLDALAAAIKRHSVKACWLMPSFHNPLGSSMPEASRQALVTMLATRNIPLIEDDVYSELYFGATQSRPAKAYDRDGLIMHCMSFSKSLAPGYRVGWVAAGRHAQRIERMKLMTTLSAAVPSQEALAVYLDQGGYDRHLRKLRGTLMKLQRVALHTIDRHFPPGTRVTRPAGGYFIWVELPTGIDALVLQQQALTQQISLAPGQLFSADHRFTNCVRINYGLPDERRLSDALKAVGRLATSLLPNAGSK